MRIFAWKTTLKKKRRPLRPKKPRKTDKANLPERVPDPVVKVEPAKLVHDEDVARPEVPVPLPAYGRHEK